MKYCIVYTLSSSTEEAKKVAHSLVKNKLAACVNIIQNVTSVYEWKGKVCEDGEFLVLIKTRKDLFEEVKEDILRNHSYELPAILMLPIEAGLQGYLEWVDENTV